MKSWLSEKENLILMAIVAVVWIGGFLLYLYSTPGPIYLEQRAEKITASVNMIYREPGDRNLQLVRMMISELMTTDKELFWNTFYRHAALALFVAGLLILFVDIHTRRETRKEGERYRQQTKDEMETYTQGVAEHVWKAVSGRLVPEEICKEIDGILKSHVLKDDCQYTITIGVPYEGLTADYIVVRREVSYIAHNLTGVEPMTYAMRSRIANILPDIVVQKEGQSITLPRHTRCVIEGKDIPPEEYLSADSPREFQYDILLPKDGGKKVYLVWDEVCILSDANFYTTITPIRDLMVRVINMVSDKVQLKEVRLHHPREADFALMQENVWVFKGGVLPGQSFSVSWGLRE